MVNGTKKRKLLIQIEERQSSQHQAIAKRLHELCNNTLTQHSFADCRFHLKEARAKFVIEAP